MSADKLKRSRSAVRRAKEKVDDAQQEIGQAMDDLASDPKALEVAESVDTDVKVGKVAIDRAARKSEKAIDEARAKERPRPRDRK